MRYAIYFTPPRQSPLTQIAAHWLGRDAFSGDLLTPDPAPGMTAERIAEATAEPRRYGFHATLKAPFRLASNQTEHALVAAFEAFCASRAAFVGPRLDLVVLDGFFALVPREPHGELSQLAADSVKMFEPFRAPLTRSEIDRRRPERLPESQRQNLERWGYPHVFGDFQFHMTLTGRAEEKDRADLRRVLAERFAPILDKPLAVTGLGLFVESEPAAAFTVLSYGAFRT